MHGNKNPRNKTDPPRSTEIKQTCITHHASRPYSGLRLVPLKPLHAPFIGECPLDVPAMAGHADALNNAHVIFIRKASECSGVQACLLTQELDVAEHMDFWGQRVQSTALLLRELAQPMVAEEKRITSSPQLFQFASAQPRKSTMPNDVEKASEAPSSLIASWNIQSHALRQFGETHRQATP